MNELSVEVDDRGNDFGDEFDRDDLAEDDLGDFAGAVRVLIQSIVIVPVGETSELSIASTNQLELRLH